MITDGTMSFLDFFWERVEANVVAFSCQVHVRYMFV